ncbi:AI-2E family transporter [Cupriavidus oxalaticus]|uniref:AI-2E family transporter n=1 Tax=Cupriavidus oxalaticus TaxID=96344 RepID=A0A4V1BZI9_9BURK|nr:AI-2E family transporter [Cupriavidus oxalaticus]QBY55482.1 AI-2E family transporter [Cupriavidus oxalaticus]
MPNIARDQASANQLNKIVGTAIVLAILYFARDVLIPVTLAFILSIFIQPLVRGLRRIGLGQVSSVALAALVLAVGLSFSGLIIGTQLIRLGSSLPQYEDTIRSKLRTLDEVTLGKLSAITDQAGRVIGKLGSNTRQGRTPAQDLPQPEANNVTPPIPVEVHQPEPRPIELLTRIVNSIARPLGTAGVVFVVLIFLLLEHEALRDRFIRLVGGSNLRATTAFVNDAGERISRFFVSQLLVNIAVGVMIWVGLAIAGLPQAPLWGAMAGLLRFVPYVGVWIAAFFAVLLATAITPGWTLALITLALFFAIELLVSQLLEPQLYGHATGLSPLSVVIAAIFWGWIWGAAGLVLSTPLTLCLVVAGRYIRALSFLEILLGEVHALTLAENFYQRALSGDAQEILASARRFLRSKPLSAYCDTVLIPALHLAHADFSQREITRTEQLKVNSAISSVLVSLESKRSWWRPIPRISVLEGTTVARRLREQRERQMGRWQGPLDVPAGTVVLGIGAGSLIDELAAEVLVRVLRAQHLDGRHLSLEDLTSGPPVPESKLEAVAVVCLVSVVSELTQDEPLAAAIAGIRRRFPHAKVLVLCASNPFDLHEKSHPVVAEADFTVHSFGETTESCTYLLQGQVSATPRQN